MFAALVFCLSCEQDTPISPTPVGTISSDAALFNLVTQTEPFGSYTPFPGLAGTSAGILSGSSAHQPQIRVSLNATARGALQNGQLPSQSAFPEGSIVFKEVLTNSGTTSIYAVMYKSENNSLAGNGWLWAEYRPGGGTQYSVNNRGGACTGCHSLDLGPRNDFVRSFERQQ